ncbi:MAG: pilus assembly protein N-terminal domain-containing protein, partial [Candidatus Binataceae bacterium]
SQAASEAAAQAVSAKVTSDPRPTEYREDEGAPAVGSEHFLPDDAIAMLLGTSRVFDFPGKLKRVSIADTEIADLQVINPHQVMLIGHKPGFTTLAVWDNQGHYEERQVRIEQTGHQQVMLNCVVAEVDRSRLENQGVNYSGALAGQGTSLVGLPGSVATSYSGATATSTTGLPLSAITSGGLPVGGQLIPMLLSTNLTYALDTQIGSTATSVFFQFLEQHNLGRILAEPHLLANSGQEAKFLSGGEIPIVIAQALNTSIVFKQYGTSVSFLPTVVGKRDIELVVKPEVSQPDQALGVELNGFQVPAFVTRRAETVVRMKDNQTLIMAGLIENDKKAVVQKVPYLGDLPFAGGLFRNTSYQDVKTEIVMSVTPQIVSALLSGAEIGYPTAGPINSREIQTERLSQPDASRPRF